MCARELPEDHLLTSFGGDALREQRRSVPSVEVREEAVDPGFAPSSETLAKVDKVSDGVEGVLVGALKGCGLAAQVENVGEESGVADFLQR